MDTTQPQPQSPLWRRMLGSLVQTTVTLMVIAMSVGLGIAGYGALEARAAKVEGPAPAPSTTVQADRLVLQDSVTLPRRFTGQFEAPQDVVLAFEEGGTVDAIFVREGDAVSRGDVIARLDTRILQQEKARLVANRDAIAAQVELSRRTNARQMQLLKDGHVAQQRVDETSLQLAQLAASLAELEAALVQVDIRLSKAVIIAPFSGRVGDRLVDAGAVVGGGAGVVRLLEDAPARYRVALDPDLAERLEPGRDVQITTGTATYSATLSELSPELDPATRSRIAFFDLEEGAHPPAGLAGDVILRDSQTARGAWVPLSALRQGPRGTWVLLTLDPSDGPARVVSEAAEVLFVTDDRAFVRGTFADGTAFLPGGTHRVVPGEAVLVAEGL